MAALVKVNGKMKRYARDYARPITKKYRQARTAVVSRAPSIQKAALVTGGGAAAGVVNSYMPEVFGVQTPLVVGSIFVAGALYLGNDSNTENDGMAYSLLCLGSGMLAVSAADFVEATLSNQNQTISNGNGGLAVAQ